jgi:hypothetical protein
VVRSTPANAIDVFAKSCDSGNRKELPAEDLLETAKWNVVRRRFLSQESSRSEKKFRESYQNIMISHGEVPEVVYTKSGEIAKKSSGFLLEAAEMTCGETPSRP